MSRPTVTGSGDGKVRRPRWVIFRARKGLWVFDLAELLDNLPLALLAVGLKRGKARLRRRRHALPPPLPLPHRLWPPARRRTDPKGRQPTVGTAGARKALPELRPVAVQRPSKSCSVDVPAFLPTQPPVRAHPAIHCHVVPYPSARRACLCHPCRAIVMPRVANRCS